MTLHAGAGGTEACDWASMLMRMYIPVSYTHLMRFITLNPGEKYEVPVKDAYLLLTYLQPCLLYTSCPMLRNLA